MTLFCADRLRWFSSRSFFRSRRFFGVASTYSSGPIYSRARSRDSFSGGVGWVAFPSPSERMVGGFFFFFGVAGGFFFRGVFPTDFPFFIFFVRPPPWRAGA